MTDDRLDYLHAVGVAVADHLAEFGDEADWADARNVDALVDVMFETPVPMILYCPACGLQHVDRDEHYGGGILARMQADAWTNPPHRSHLCAGCGHQWRPADVPTVGVEALETRGTRDAPTPDPVRGNWVAAADVERMALELDRAAGGTATRPRLVDAVAVALPLVRHARLINSRALNFNAASFDYALGLKRDGVLLNPRDVLKVGDVILAALNTATRAE